MGLKIIDIVDINLGGIQLNCKSSKYGFSSDPNNAEKLHCTYNINEFIPNLCDKNLNIELWYVIKLIFIMKFKL